MAGRVVNVTGMPRPLPEGVVYVGRRVRGLPGSRWANPFRIGDPHPSTAERMTRDDVLALYREWIAQQMVNDPDLLDPLRGKSLACWCAPLPCHADILVGLLGVLE